MLNMAFDILIIVFVNVGANVLCTNSYHGCFSSTIRWLWTTGQNHRSTAPPDIIVNLVKRLIPQRNKLAVSSVYSLALA